MRVITDFVPWRSDNKAWKDFEARQTADAVNTAERKKQIEEIYGRDGITMDEMKRLVEKATREAVTANSNEHQELKRFEQVLESYIAKANPTKESREMFEAGYVAAWDKLDDDLFNTARLITCGKQYSCTNCIRAITNFVP
jgi:hypothetical protein